MTEENFTRRGLSYLIRQISEIFFNSLRKEIAIIYSEKITLSTSHKTKAYHYL